MHLRNYIIGNLRDLDNYFWKLFNRVVGSGGLRDILIPVKVAITLLLSQLHVDSITMMIAQEHIAIVI